MLIVTSRHTEADLARYNSLYKQIDVLTAVPACKVAETARLTRDWHARHADAVAYTSWGKDSVALLWHIAEMGLKMPVVYMRLKNSRANPDCDLVRDAFLARYPAIDYNEESFVYEEVHDGDKHWKAIAGKYGRHRITGIRNEESGVRLMVYKRFRDSSEQSCRPLSLWRGAEVFALIEQQSLPLCPVYGYIGGGRWPRERIRTHSIVGSSGDNHGRTEWEREYYPDIVNMAMKASEEARVCGRKT